MRLHLVGLPHTQTTPDYVWCAYTAKITKFATMMHRQGHEVYLYAGTENTAECTEHIEVVTEEEREKWFGHYDWDRNVFNGFQHDAPWWAHMNLSALEAIQERCEPGDFLGIIAGICQKPLADALPNLLPVEWGIGYSGVWAPYRVYESYAWMHHLAAKRPTDDVRFFDTVIPNFFDPTEFRPRSGSDGEYLLFLGRHTPRKGTAIVEEIAKRADIPVVTAGQGSTTIEGTTHVGVVRGEEKAQLIAGARALLCPTIYLEPFGGVAVEAMLSGTPAISTDYGAFTETIVQGASGYRCSTLAEFMAGGSTAPTHSNAYGGNGGAGGGGASGSGGAVSGYASLLTNTGCRVPKWGPAVMLGHYSIGAVSTYIAKGGGGGGGGGGDGTAGGGGGSGGGAFVMAAKSLVNNGTISANGGNGGSPAAGNRGGGGGGGGGYIGLVYDTKTGSGTITANGGNGGTHTGTGTDGFAGSGGTITQVVNA